ncbi:MAG: hypothetical protein IKS34_00765, partial [Clostridia bacterium]|nr:hypothetical protein [Clostridia bacterium]
NIPKRLSDLVDDLMEKDPADRPAAWSDVVDELKTIRQELGGSADAPEDAPEKRKKPGTGRVSAASRKPRVPVFVISAASALLLFVIMIVIALAMTSKKDGGNGKDGPRASSNTPSVSVKPASATKPDPVSVRDEAFYQARWKMIQAESKDSGLELKQIEQFVTEAGPKAPAEAVDMLKKLRAEEKQSRALTLRNDLLDRAVSFNPEDAKKLSFEKIDDLYNGARSKRDELAKLDAELSEPVFLPEHRATVDEYVRRLADLQLALSLGGDVATVTKPAQDVRPDSPKTESATAERETSGPDSAEDSASSAPEEKDEPEDKDDRDSVTGTVKDSKLMLNYLLLLDCLPNAVKDESERADALRMLNELLADKAFTDELPRKNCLGIRKFLVLNSAPLLPYLAGDESALRGMKLFPFSYPDSVLDDITDSTIRLKIPDRKASIIQRLAWNKLRREEGEDRIVVTLINSPQLAKLAAEFREYLYVRAIFLGVDPELLQKRYDRASGLSEEKKEELNRIAGFFRESVLDEDD